MSISPVSGLQAASIIVDPTAGYGNYTTIQAAITAASSGQTILIKPGTYTENLTLKVGVNLTAFDCDSATPNVTILGTCTLTAAGTVSISGILLKTNSAPFLTVSGSAASVVNLINCYLVCSNNTGISFTSSSGSALIQCTNCFGDVTTTGIAMYSMTSAGVLNLFYSNWSNSGGSTTASSNSAGVVQILYCLNIKSPISTSSTGQITSNESSISATITTAGTGASSFTGTTIDGGSSSAISVGSGTTVTLINCYISSLNANAITGAGTVKFQGVCFTNTSNTINTTTQTNKVFLPGSMNSVLPAGDYTVLASDMFVGATSSAARAITLPASPVAGQQHIVKDITGTAATNNITVSGNGSNIIGATSASTYVMNINYQSATFVYTGTVWAVV